MTLRDPVERMLRLMPATRSQMRDKLYISRSSVQRLIRLMHTAGWCYIGKWLASDGSGPFQPIYHAGPGKDKPCTLAPITAAEACRRTRAKGDRDIRLAKDRIRKKIKRLAGKKAHPWDQLK